MTLIYSEPYYDSYDRQYIQILVCDTTDVDIMQMCIRYLRKPLSTFQTMNYRPKGTFALCNYAFKNQAHCGKLMTIQDMPQLFMLLSHDYEFDYKMGKLIEKQNIDMYGRKFICMLTKK